MNPTQSLWWFGGDKRLINEVVYMRILQEMQNQESKGWDLNLDILIPELSETVLAKNISYLVESNLIKRDDLSHNFDDTFGIFLLTSRGFDFLSENGGLTKAINEKLNTIIIKIDEEQFRALLIDRVNQSNLTDNEKQGIVSAIKNLPSEMVTTLATKLLETGLENLLDVLPSIGIG